MKRYSRIRQLTRITSDASDVKWMKGDRNGGEKRGRIELGRSVRKIHGKTMEIRRKHVNVMNMNTGIKQTGNQIFYQKQHLPCFLQTSVL